MSVHQCEVHPDYLQTMRVTLAPGQGVSGPILSTPACAACLEHFDRFAQDTNRTMTINRIGA